jgi:hypothetical protein
MTLAIEPGGRVRCVYDDALDLGALGRVVITRASHVEPDPDGRWTADLSPVGGPVLGPFGRRSEALAAERTWLDRNWPPAPNQGGHPGAPLPVTRNRPRPTSRQGAGAADPIGIKLSRSPRATGR